MKIERALTQDVCSASLDLRVIRANSTSTSDWFSNSSDSVLYFVLCESHVTHALTHPRTHTHFNLLDRSVLFASNTRILSGCYLPDYVDSLFCVFEGIFVVYIYIDLIVYLYMYKYMRLVVYCPIVWLGVICRGECRCLYSVIHLLYCDFAVGVGSLLCVCVTH